MLCPQKSWHPARLSTGTGLLPRQSVCELKTCCGRETLSGAGLGSFDVQPPGRCDRAVLVTLGTWGRWAWRTALPEPVRSSPRHTWLTGVALLPSLGFVLLLGSALLLTEWCSLLESGQRGSRWPVRGCGKASEQGGRVGELCRLEEGLVTPPQPPDSNILRSRRLWMGRNAVSVTWQFGV